MMGWLGSPNALMSLVIVWWSALIVWRIAATAGSRRVWLALAAFALSATLYVGPVSRFAASVVGSEKPCDQFENLWGVGVSGLIVVVLCVWSNRALAVAVAIATGAAIIGMLVLAEETTPSPVGCVATLELPWSSPYWWIITVAHVAAALAAAVICIRDAAAIGGHDRVAALAVGGVAAGFMLSAGFWLLIWTSLVTGASSPAVWGSANVFPATVACMTLCALVVAIDSAVTVARHRGAITSAWQEYRIAFGAANPGWSVPGRWEVLGPWWSHPAQSLHQLRIQICDLELACRAEPTAPATTEAHRGGITS